MSYRAIRLGAIATLTLVVGAACRESPTATTHASVREISAVVLTGFLTRNPPELWPQVFISGEYNGVQIDSAFLSRLPLTSVPIGAAYREGVWISFGIVRDGALLLEPGPIARESQRIAALSLSFWSSQEFAGELFYRVGETITGKWQILSLEVKWIV